MHDLIQRLLDWYQATLQSGGYPLIVLLMAMESSVIPLPSEVIIPPAAYLARSQGHLTLMGVVLAGTLGSWIGASVMYWAARAAGRPLVLKFSAYWEAKLAGWPLTLRFVRHFLVSEERLAGAERWSARFGSMGIFVARMLPVIRHLIGIPSGIIRLNFLRYSLFTIAGSATWCAVLAAVGNLAGGDPALLHGDLAKVALGVAGAAGLMGALYYFFVYRISRSTA